jgi:hypothetical protein
MMKASLKLLVIGSCLLFVCLTGFTQARPTDAGLDAGNGHWRLKREIQIGDAFTSVTLLAGFTGFLIATIKDRRKKARDDSQSGALRLLLKILRENRGPMKLADLKNVFDSAEARQAREAYCGKDFKFKNFNTFEAAVYRLHWEAKIDFVSSDEAAFRVHERFDSNPSLAIAIVPPSLAMFTISKNAFVDRKIDQWGLEPLARSALTYDRQATSEFLAEAAKSTDAEAQRRAAVLLGKFPPPRHVATS